MCVLWERRQLRIQRGVCCRNNVYFLPAAPLYLEKNTADSVFSITFLFSYAIHTSICKLHHIVCDIKYDSVARKFDGDGNSYHDLLGVVGYVRFTCMEKASS